MREHYLARRCWINRELIWRYFSIERGSLASVIKFKISHLIWSNALHCMAQFCNDEFRGSSELITDSAVIVKIKQKKVSKANGEN